MILFPNAKINIGLYITEKRPDGYHNLESIFVPIDWTDILEITPSQDFAFTSSGIPIPGKPESNLCIKAFQLLQEAFHIPNVSIHLHKIIPMGAGLGGGSADAAFTLIGLRDLFNLSLSNEELIPFAQKLGSDCPFFLLNSPQFGTEKGDRLEPISLHLNGLFGLLVYPKINVSTQEAYSGVLPVPAPNFLPTEISRPVQQWKEAIYNDFEKNIFPKYPLLSEVKDALYALGAIYSSMSGSGSTLFGIFEKEPNTEVFDKQGYITKIVAF